MKLAHTLPHFFCGLILIAFAALQFNDPDSIIWILFYLLCASVVELNAINQPQLKPIKRGLFWLAILACLLAMGLHIEGAYNYYLHRDTEPLVQSMNPDKPYIEEAREFLGAGIALALVLLSNWLAARQQKQ